MISDRAAVSTRHALTWITLSSLLGAVIGLGGDVMLRGSRSDYSTSEAIAILAIMTTASVCAWALSFLAVQSSARVLGGVGRYRDLAYASAAIATPLTVLSGLTFAVSDYAIVVVGLYLYWTVAYIEAVRVVNQFSLWRAAASVLLTAALLILGMQNLLFVTAIS